MKNRLSAAIASALLCGLSVCAYAQDAITDNDNDNVSASDLDAVIVTGTRTPKAVDKIPGAITIVSTEEVQHTLLLTEDATAVLARTVPGYAESTQALSNTGETLRGRIPLRLFDGVPQGSPLREGGRSATFTDLGVIGRIEVINGPSASEGIGASGGIINYISRTPTKEGNETTLTTRYGSQGYSDSDNYKVGVTFGRKQDAYDVFIAGSYVDRGITYDADGRRIGINTSGSVSDSEAKNLFFKVGYNFGEGQTQRLQATYSKFNIDGKGNYVQVIGCRAVPSDDPPCGERRTNTSERGEIFGSRSAFNDFEQQAVQYSNTDFFGGSLVLDVYTAKQAMRYLPENGDDRQLVKVGPDFDESTRIFDQSEIRAKKQGFRSAWTRGSLFNVDGLEMRIGFDYVDDQADQRLALTDRLWVPPLKYKSRAPFAQLTWDVGPITISGGARREDDELTVDSYTTTAFRNAVFVQGGGVQYKETLKNLGAIWRVTDQWSTFVSYGEGFGLPNIGIPLRNVSVPGQSVDRIDGLAAIIFDNVEAGFNWRGRNASLGGSAYRSKSDFGASLAVDPGTNDFILTRSPVTIEGVELTGEYRFSDSLKATALYSRIRGKTSFYGGGPLERPLGVLDVNPDKFGASVTWNFLANADLTVGSTTLFSRDVSGSDVNAATGRTYSFTENTTGHTLLDLGVNYDTGRFGKLSLGIDNLLDRQYLLTGSQIDQYLNYWAGRGRTITFTHTLTF